MVAAAVVTIQRRQRRLAGVDGAPGSTARGADTEASDCDFIADLKPRATLAYLGKMKRLLEGLLGCRVDITSRRVVSAEANVAEESILL